MSSQQYPVHEGMQVYNGSQFQLAPEIVHFTPPQGGYEKFDIVELPGDTTKKICGLAARTFWIILGVVILLIVIAAAVGGGVGGSLAAKHSKDAASLR